MNEPTPAPFVGPLNLFDALAAETIANLRETYHLVDVAHDDKLTDEQVDWLLADDYERFWDSTAEWEYDNQLAGADYYARQEVADVVATWAVERDMDVHDVPTLDGGDLIEEFIESEAWDRVIEAIRDRDRSEWLRDLARGCSRIGMRQVMGTEDDAIGGHLWGEREVTATDVLTAIRTNAPGSTIKRNAHNVRVLREVIEESGINHETKVAMIVYAADVSELLLDLGEAEYVDVVNPHVYLGNPWMGDGYCSDEPIHGTVRIKRTDLTTDKGAWGYGWDNVASPVWSYYEADVRPAPAPEIPEAPASKEHAA